MILPDSAKRVNVSTLVAATVCDQPLPPGGYKLYLARDAILNGILDLAALWGFDVSDITVQRAF